MPRNSLLCQCETLYSLKCLTFLLAIFFQFTFNTITSASRNIKGLSTKLWTFPLDQEIITESPIGYDMISSIPKHWLYNPNQLPFFSSFLKAHHTTFLYTRSKSFSKSTAAKFKFFFFAAYFFLNCLNIHNVAENQTTPHQSLCYLTNLSATLIVIFICFQISQSFSLSTSRRVALSNLGARVGVEVAFFKYYSTYQTFVKHPH